MSTHPHPLVFPPNPHDRSRDFAKRLDQSDPLHSFRDKFHVPGKDRGLIYFTGNSLGLQPIGVSRVVQEELEDWEQLAGDAHFHGRRPWYSYHELFAEPLSRIVGCLPSECVSMNSLTVNLHLLLVSFYQPTRQRFKIICEQKAFPSDQYALQSHVSFRGYPKEAIVEVKPRERELTIRHEDILRVIDENRESVALVFFGGVNYYTGQVFDMASITQAAHDAGAVAGFDLAHAAGNIELHLHNWNVDFACWCTYKYLNAGPGSVGGAFIHESHHRSRLHRLAGWWGHNKHDRFLMEPGFDPIPTAEGWQLSNAPVLSMAPLKASLKIFDEAGMQQIVEKGQHLSDYLFFLMDEIISRFRDTVQIITPRSRKEKGCQISLVIRKHGKKLFDQISRHVSAGWREPEVIRVAPVPLYNTFEEVWQFSELVRENLEKLAEESR